MQKLTQKRLKEIIDYDEKTGIFLWEERQRKGGGRVGFGGEIAGCLDKNSGYIFIGIDRNLYRAHRIAWLYIHGYFPEHQVDHINGIRDDNRLVNLREATNMCNAQNKRILNANTSGITGVSWQKKRKKWRSRIEINKKSIHLGYFKDLLGAAKARYIAEQKYYHCVVRSSAQLYIETQKANYEI